MKLYFLLLCDINQHDINLILGFMSYVAKDQTIFVWRARLQKQVTPFMYLFIFKLAFLMYTSVDINQWSSFDSL